jgi:hypothetical protein
MADRHPGTVGTYVEPHQPHVINPAGTAAAEAAHAEGESATQQRRNHYHRNAAGGQAGDPMAAESAEQPPPVRPPRIYQQPGEPGQP